MLIVDVSNLAHIGSKGRYFLLYNDTTFKAIPFILNKIASLVAETENVIFVFDPKPNGKKLDYHREYDPQVVFEVNVLYDILKKVGMNPIRVQGYSADDVICNLAERYQQLPGKKYILTEDRDLVSAVHLDEESGGTIELLGPTVGGDHITPFNMYLLTRIPYNFTDVFKTILGCKSDGIKPLVNGSLLWKNFQEHIAKKRFQIRGRVENAYQYIDITLYNNKDYLLEWLSAKGVDGRANADIVFPRTLDTNGYPFRRLDWIAYNSVFKHMFGQQYTNQKHDAPRIEQSMIDFVMEVIKENSIQSASVFEPVLPGAIHTLDGLDDFDI